ncbi:hypothetical protein TKK_0011154 [Trichogramma kaykai]
MHAFPEYEPETLQLRRPYETLLNPYKVTKGIAKPKIEIEYQGIVLRKQYALEKQVLEEQAMKNTIVPSSALRQLRSQPSPQPSSPPSPKPSSPPSSQPSSPSSPPVKKSCRPILYSESEDEGEKEEEEEEEEEEQDDDEEKRDGAQVQGGIIDDILPSAMAWIAIVLRGLMKGQISGRRRMPWINLANYYRVDARKLAKKVHTVVRKWTAHDLAEMYGLTLDDAQRMRHTFQLRRITTKRAF